MDQWEAGTYQRPIGSCVTNGRWYGPMRALYKNQWHILFYELNAGGWFQMYKSNKEQIILLKKENKYISSWSVFNSVYEYDYCGFILK